MKRSIAVDLFAIVGLACALQLLTASAAQAQLVPLEGNHPDLSKVIGGSAQRPAPPDMLLTMSVFFKLRNVEELEQLRNDQQDPSSPNYQKWLETGEFARRFGPTREDFDAVAGWVESQGFRTTNETFGTPNPSVEFKGTVAQVQQVFHVTIVLISDAGAYANASDPLIPSRFHDTISAIWGLDNLASAEPGVKRPPRFERRHRSRSRTGAGIQLVSIKTINGVPVTAFGPSDARVFYSIDPVAAGGMDGAVTLPGKTMPECIGVLALSNFISNATTLFESEFALPQSSVSKVIVTTDPGMNSFESEALIDIEWAHAIAPILADVARMTRSDRAQTMC
jgi:subtilase family serine protease